MIFGQPLFLFALIPAVAIPVIIHLFNFRRYKKIWFTNVRFISEITQESRKRNELKHLLILLARILALSAIVLAFALPYIPSPLQKSRFTGVRHISIFLDNSFSMEALNKNGNLLDEAKQKAIAIANASAPSDLFQLTTMDLEGKHQHFVNRDELISMVNEVRISPAVLTLGEIMSRQAEFLATAGGTSSTAYIISDFQRSITVMPERPDTMVNWLFIPVNPSRVNNLYIDSAWFENPSRQPAQPLSIHTRIRNSSAEAFEKIPLKLTINGVQKAVSGFSIDPQGETTVILPFTNNMAGMQFGSLEITDYPITWDDTFYLSYMINPSISVLCINEETENAYLNALFKDDSTFEFRNISIRQPEYSAFNRFQLIILSGVKSFSSGLIQELSRYVDAGGNVMVIPPDNGDLASLNTFLASAGIAPLDRIDTTRLRVSGINIAHPVFSDVFAVRSPLPENADLPMAMRHYTSSRLTRSATQDLMKLQNGDLFLSVTSREKGKVYLLYSPLTEQASNFPRNSIFVPTLYKIALLSQPSIPVFNTIASAEGIGLPGDTAPSQEVYRIRKNDEAFEIIPEVRRSNQTTMLYPHEQIREAGNYTIYGGKKALYPVSFNFDRKESVMDYYSPEEVRELAGRKGIYKSAILKGQADGLGRQIRQLNQGTPLWKYFIIAALAFLLTEIILIRVIQGTKYKVQSTKYKVKSTK